MGLCEPHVLAVGSDLLLAFDAQYFCHVGKGQDQAGCSSVFGHVLVERVQHLPVLVILWMVPDVGLENVQVHVLIFFFSPQDFFFMSCPLQKKKFYTMERIERLLQDPLTLRLVVQYLPTGNTTNVAKDTAKILVEEIERLSIEEQELVTQFGQSSIEEDDAASSFVQSIIDEEEQADYTVAGGSEMTTPVEKAEAYIRALRELWRLLSTGTEQQFVSQLTDSTTRKVRYPTLMRNLMQFTMVDHDLSSSSTTTPAQLRILQRDMNNPANLRGPYLKIQRMLSVLHARRPGYCERAAASDDFGSVVLASVMLYLRRKGIYVGTAVAWAKSSKDARTRTMRRLLSECDVLDLRVRFVMDKDLYDRRVGLKHKGDYYRLVLLQLLKPRNDELHYRGMAVDSEPVKTFVNPAEVVAALTDLDPSSERRGFLLQPYEDAVSYSRSKEVIDKLIEKAKALMQDPETRARVLEFRSREAQRRLLMLSKLSNKTLEKLGQLPLGVLLSMGSA